MCTASSLVDESTGHSHSHSHVSLVDSTLQRIINIFYNFSINFQQSNIRG
jgi:hypothetical protein